MKIGNIKEVVRKCVESYKSFTVPDGTYASISVDTKVKRMPLEHLEKWFQERYNKNVDYDQWVGIRDELDKMGRNLYESFLIAIGDVVLIVQSENQKKIQELEMSLKEEIEAHSKTKAELKKYID